MNTDMSNRINLVRKIVPNNILTKPLFHNGFGDCCSEYIIKYIEWLLIRVQNLPKHKNSLGNGEYILQTQMSYGINVVRTSAAI